MTRSRVLTGLLSILVGLLSFSAVEQSSHGLEAPSYSVGSRWEYTVTGQLESLAGFNDTTGNIQVQGLAVAEATSVDVEFVNLSWRSDLTVGGTLSLPAEGDGLEASLAGGIDILRKEQYEPPYFLPLETQSTTGFDLELAAFGLSLEYSASVDLTVTQTPTPSFPTYPLEVGEKRVTLESQVETTTRFSLPGNEIENASAMEVESVLIMEATAGHGVEVPAGKFQAMRVTTEAVEGVVLGVLQELFPGTDHVAYYSNEVGNAVLIQFLMEGTEVGNATLRSYTLPSPTPFWQHPIFLGGLLVVPVAILLYFYVRERRRGL